MPAPFRQDTLLECGIHPFPEPHQVDRAIQEGFEFAFEVNEGVRLELIEANPHIHVAGCAGFITGHRAKQADFGQLKALLPVGQLLA